MNLDNNALWKATGIGAVIVLVLSLLNQIPYVGFIFCCILWIAYAGVGAMYGVFARRNGSLVTAGSAALGGGIAAALSGIVQGIIGAIVSLFFVSSDAVAQSLAQLEAQGFDVPPEFYEMYTGAGFGVASAVIGICFAFFIAAVMGAIGGAIYGATQRPSTPPPPPPAPPASPTSEGPVKTYEPDDSWE